MEHTLGTLKTFLIFLLSLPLLAQTNTIGYTFNVQVNTYDVPVVIAPTQDWSVALPNYIAATNAGLSLLTLTGSITSSATTVTLNSNVGISVGNGLCLSLVAQGNVCGVLVTTSGVNVTPITWAWSGGEIMRVASVSGDGHTVTVTRSGSTLNSSSGIGTPAAWANGHGVVVTRYGSYSDYAAGYFTSNPPPPVTQIVSNPQYGAYSALQIQAAQATLSTLQAAH